LFFSKTLLNLNINHQLKKWTVYQPESVEKRQKYHTLLKKSSMQKKNKTKGYQIGSDELSPVGPFERF